MSVVIHLLFCYNLQYKIKIYMKGTRNMNKPVIGIISKHSEKDEIRPNTYIRDEVKQAIFDNGAVAIGILLPKDEKLDVGDDWVNNLSLDEYDSLIAQINLCDGIIFQGGGACDNYEMIVAKYCYDHDIPTLGICCGQNVIVRALGGTTYKIFNPEKHNQITEDYVHNISIDALSKFYDIVKQKEIKVNSRHKKTIENSPLLEKVAFCEDGYPDVVESKEKRFYIGVRFHPESLYKIDENMNNIFKYFIDVCKD